VRPGRQLRFLERVPASTPAFRLVHRLLDATIRSALCGAAAIEEAGFAQPADIDGVVY
jgi:hypothetical protein